MLRLAFGIVMVLGLCAQIKALAVTVNGEFEELKEKVSHLEAEIANMKECHVDVNVISDKDAHSDGGHAVDINLHVQDGHHEDDHDEHHEEAAHDVHKDYYANVHLKACPDTHHNTHGEIHMEHLKEEGHLELVVVVHEALPNTEYIVKVYDHGHKDDHCDFRASETFDPENPAEHKGELGKFTTDKDGHAHHYIGETHFSLRGGHGKSIYGHIVSVDTAQHTDECHGLVGHSTEKEEYHEFVQHHKQRDYDFGPEDVYAVCHMHSGVHDGHVTGVKGDVHFAQHTHGEHDMQIRADITGAKANTHYSLVEYMHGDTGHKCIDMGEKYDTVHHEKHDYGFTTDADGNGHAIFYNTHNTLLSNNSDENVAGYAFAINDDGGHHEACCVVGLTTYDVEHHHFRHEKAHYDEHDSYAVAHMRVHESNFDSHVTAEVHIMQHQTEPNKAEVRIDLDHLRDAGYERLQLYIDDHQHAKEIHDCPHYDHLDEENFSHYIGDFHTEKGHEVEHWGFRDVHISLKGEHSVIGSIIAVYDGEDPAHHALVCGVIEKGTYEEEHHFETIHGKDDVHYV